MSFLYFCVVQIIFNKLLFKPIYITKISCMFECKNVKINLQANTHFTRSAQRSLLYPGSQSGTFHMTKKKYSQCEADDILKLIFFFRENKT